MCGKDIVLTRSCISDEQQDGLGRRAQGSSTTAALGSLTLVGTPLGNLHDLSDRARQVLQQAELILCEDTRVTRKLVSHVGSHARLIRGDERSLRKDVTRFVEQMLGGAHLVYCSDAGMPCLSDPGSVLVDACYEAGIAVDVVPGPTALSSALALSGFEYASLLFAGFAPRKSGERRRLFSQIASMSLSLEALSPVVVWYESPYRVMSLVDDIAQAFPHRRLAVVREITKLHQEVIRGLSQEVHEALQNRGSIKGECVVVLDHATQQALHGSDLHKGQQQAPRYGEQHVELGADDGSMQHAQSLSDESCCHPSANHTPLLLGSFIDAELAHGVPKTQLAKVVARKIGVSKQEAYALIVARAQDGHA